MSAFDLLISLAREVFLDLWNQFIIPAGRYFTGLLSKFLIFLLLSPRG
jgi:hypothetical protein